MLKLKPFYFGYIMRRQGSLEKTMMLGKTEGNRKRRPNVRWNDSIKGATDTILQEVSRAVEDRILWTSLIHRVAKRQGHTTHTQYT